MFNKIECINENHSTTRLCYKLLDDKYLDENGKIKEEYKFSINIPKLKIQNSKFIGKPEDKFETTLFLPEGEGRKGEGGLRTKGLFKFSYENLIQNDKCLIMDESKKANISNKNKIQNPTSKIQHSKKWYIVDHDGNPVEPAPDYIQEKINTYINNTSPKTEHPTSNIQNSTFNKLPLITVITVVYNGAKYLEETIQSVINQTYPNVEYIIIDGGSTDGTLDIMKKYEDYIDYWISEKDAGIYDAMNKGVEVAFGNWVYFLGSDDALVDNQVFYNLIPEIEPTLIAISGLVKTKGRIVKSKFSIKLYLHNTVHHQATLYRTILFKSFRYDEKCKIVSDYELNLIIFLKKKRIKLNKLLIAVCGDSGISNCNWKLAHKEMKIIRSKYFARTTNMLLNFLLDVKLFVHKVILCLK